MDRCKICGRLVGYSENEEGIIIGVDDIRSMLRNGTKVLRNWDKMCEQGNKQAIQETGWIPEARDGDILCNSHFEQWYTMLGFTDENEYYESL